MAVSQILRRAREHKRLTVAQLANLTGIRARTIRAYERSERDPFGASFSSFCVLCDRLNLDVFDMAYLATHGGRCDYAAQQTLFED